MEPKSIKNHSKNRCEKRDEKKGAIPEKTLARQNARNPQRLSFQKNPSEENREESRLKGENKVECKKWSAKGKCRKASADREPTTHSNTLGGQRPRADRLRAFRLAKVSRQSFVGLWVAGLWAWACVCVCVRGPKGVTKQAR